MIKATLLCLVLVWTTMAQGYEELIHQDLSLAALKASRVANDNSARSRLGLPRSLFGPDSPYYPNSEGKLGTIAQLIQDGANFEDSGLRSINHFFDPRSTAPLSLNAGDYLTPWDSVGTQALILTAVGAVNALATTSPDWALGTFTTVSRLPQTYSYADLKKYYLQSVTDKSNAVRAQAVGLSFETLGRIIHHVQDMAQPQHVRNDIHLRLDEFERDCTGLIQAVYGPICPAYKSLRGPSTYEQWTTFVRSSLPMNGYDPVYGPSSDGLGTFGDARRFWTYFGKGMADFTNRNFLSVNTMKVAPPGVGNRYVIKAIDLCNGAVPTCGVVNADDVVVFYSSVVDDQFRPSTGGPHPYAAADSIFDPDYRRLNLAGAPQTVNRFTFVYDHAYLLPRAIGYSAGFINYFFRGEMEIAPPPEGIYGIVDHTAAGCGNPCGFRKLKLNLKNTTAGNEAMGAGSLWAVIKFHLNTCYKPDLSGEYGAPAFAGETCRSPDESIAVSAPLAVSAVSSAGAQTLEFNFNSNAIPINASDVLLQVVFRGKLGAEDDAIAVSTLDISEPNFYALTNVTDFVFDTATQKYNPLGYKNYQTPNVVTNIRFAFGQNSAANAATAVASLDRLGGGEHAQFAVLLPKGQAIASTEWSGDYASPGEQYPWDTQEFSQDDIGPYAGKYTRTCPVHPIRGMYRQYGLFFVQQVVDRRASILKDEVLPAEGQTSGVARKPTKTNPKAAVAPNCAPWPSTGYYDFSAMPALTPATAAAWQIRF